jgi:hypothetical protein
MKSRTESSATSGTTGRLKGAVLSHRNLVAMAVNCLADILRVPARRPASARGASVTRKWFVPDSGAIAGRGEHHRRGRRLRSEPRPAFRGGRARHLAPFPRSALQPQDASSAISASYGLGVKCLHLCRFFGRRRHERSLLLWRPASKKRQGTKSRGGLGGGRQPAPWGFDFHAGYGGGREAGARRSG